MTEIKEEDEVQQLAFKINDLQEFRMEYKDYTVYEQINDATVLSLVDSQYFKHNKELKLSVSESITNNLFKSLSNDENSKYIQIMILNDLYIDDKALNGMAKGKNLILEEIEINNCDGIKGQGLINYFSSMNVKRLKRLTLNNLSIGNEVVISLISNKTRYTGINKTGASLQFFKGATQLYQSLIQPIYQIGLLDKKHLIIIPDDSLHSIPFEALVKDTVIKNNYRYQYLLQDNAISYYPSATTLYQERQLKSTILPNHTKTALLVGNPLVSRPKNDPRRDKASRLDKAHDLHDLQPSDNQGSRNSLDIRLPNATIEVNNIAKIFPNSDTLLHATATENAIKTRDLTQYRYLHFACHGAIDRKQPILSGLALATTTDSLNDDYLRTYEIFDLKLQADLVVLSACETGLGKITPEGIIGLTRSWLYAGTPSLVVSLWKVEDESTARLMTDFYKNLKVNNKDKYGALRQAQLKMIQQGKEPFYWAGFVFIGQR